MSFLRLGAALRDNGFHLLKRIHNTALLYFSSGFSHSVVKKQVRCPVWQTGPLGVPT